MSTDLRIMGLDLSLNHTGLAYPGGSTEVLAPTKLRSTARHAAIRKDVLERIRGASADLVISEAPLTTGGRARSSTDLDLIMLHGVINVALWSNRIAVAHIHPSTLKRFATGKGNADKGLMRQALVEHLGALTPTDDNEVDAAWLRIAGLERYGQRLFAMPAEQVAALDVAVWPDIEDVLAAAL